MDRQLQMLGETCPEQCHSGAQQSDGRQVGDQTRVAGDVEMDVLDLEPNGRSSGAVEAVSVGEDDISVIDR